MTLDPFATLSLEPRAPRCFAPVVQGLIEEANVGVTEYQRHQLFTWLEEQMGQERATTMMDMLPATGFADLATKQDLAALESRITTKVVGWILASQATTMAVVSVLVSIR